MTGIGQTSIDSAMQILTSVQVNGINFEIILHALPYGIMIGRKVLVLGITVHISCSLM